MNLFQELEFLGYDPICIREVLRFHNTFESAANELNKSKTQEIVSELMKKNIPWVQANDLSQKFVSVESAYEFYQRHLVEALGIRKRLEQMGFKECIIRSVLAKFLDLEDSVDYALNMQTTASNLEKKSNQKSESKIISNENAISGPNKSLIPDARIGQNIIPPVNNPNEHVNPSIKEFYAGIPPPISQYSQIPPPNNLNTTLSQNFTIPPVFNPIPPTNPITNVHNFNSSISIPPPLIPNYKSIPIPAVYDPNQIPPPLNSVPSVQNLNRIPPVINSNLPLNPVFPENSLIPPPLVPNNQRNPIQENVWIPPPPSNPILNPVQINDLRPRNNADPDAPPRNRTRMLELIPSNVPENSSIVIRVKAPVQGLPENIVINRNDLGDNFEEAYESLSAFRIQRTLSRRGLAPVNRRNPENEDLYEGLFRNNEIFDLLNEIFKPEGLTENDLKKVKKVKYSAENYKSPTCAICYDDFTEGLMVNELKCHHIFHIDCVQPWLQSSVKCPLCKEPQLT